MATRFIEKVNGANDTTEIVDNALGLQRVPDLPSAAGLVSDKHTGKLKYNKQGAIVDVVTSDNVEVASVDDSTIEYATGTIRVKDEGITEAKLDPAIVTLLDLLADLPTANVAAPAIWNDSGVLKVGTAT